MASIMNEQNIVFEFIETENNTQPTIRELSHVNCRFFLVGERLQ